MNGVAKAVRERGGSLFSLERGRIGGRGGGGEGPIANFLQRDENEKMSCAKFLRAAQSENECELYY